MLLLENEVADYVRETRNHVLYRAPPVFEDINLLARGMVIGCQSIENDDNLFLFTATTLIPGFRLNTPQARAEPWKMWKQRSTNGKHWADCYNRAAKHQTDNRNSEIFHRPDYSAIEKIKPKYREEVSCSKEEFIEQGYAVCKLCKP